MDFRILGPLEVVGAGGVVTIRAAKLRALLALLLLHANTVVSTDALIDAMWPAGRPASGARLLQVYVSQLRRALGEEGRITTRPAGYRLTVGPEELDGTRFERALAEGRAALAQGNPERARRVLGRGLALWRGPALADVGDLAEPHAEAQRLEELRLAALEARIDADLAVGAAGELVEELRSLVHRHPLREHLRGQLMLALYRAGRQSEALDSYADARRTLRDELGLDPGAALRALHAAVLRHDPALDPPTTGVRPSLPAALSPMLGRERELADVVDLLRRDDGRLVTLVGAGGSGKTRLALEVARTLADETANGAFVVELAPVRQPALVPAAIGAVIGIEPAPGESTVDSLRRRLRHDDVLLVIDNAEHLDGVGELAVELLRAAAGLRILVTSRVVLHVSGERVYPVAPLAPGPARQLFVLRARASDPDFAPDTVDDTVIADICDRVDRLPLAIELAAPWVRTLSLDAIRGRLHQRLLLTGGPRDLPMHQRTLADTIAWSTDRLSKDERRTLAQLSVFADGCTVEAAEDVCGATLDAVRALVDSSLVERTRSPTGAVRLTMLETIREHAAGLLNDSGERSAVEASYVAHHVALAESAVFKGPETQSWVETVDRELENIRVAYDIADDDPALRIATALYRYWYLRGYFREGRDRIRRPLDRGAGDDRLRASALHGLAGLSWLAGDDDAEALALRGIEAGTRAGMPAAVMGCHTVVAMAARDRGDLALAAAHVERSAALAAELGLDEDVMVANTNLAALALAAGDLDGARDRWERSMEMNRAGGFGDVDDFALLGLGEVAYREERLEDAETLLYPGAAAGRARWATPPTRLSRWPAWPP